MSITHISPITLQFTKQPISKFSLVSYTLSFTSLFNKRASKTRSASAEYSRSTSSPHYMRTHVGLRYVRKWKTSFRYNSSRFLLIVAGSTEYNKLILNSQVMSLGFSIWGGAKNVRTACPNISFWNKWISIIFGTFRSVPFRSVRCRMRPLKMFWEIQLFLVRISPNT
jgi:hypothetical protein